MKLENTPLKEIKSWQANLDLFRIKIHLPDDEYQNTLRLQGWTYYIIIPERACPQKFEHLWITPEPVKHNYVMYNYYNCPLDGLNWHGGVTFYQKHGEVVGHRAVEFGCDYSHSWDIGNHYTLADVYADALTTLDEIKAWIAQP